MSKVGTSQVSEASGCRWCAGPKAEMLLVSVCFPLVCPRDVHLERPQSSPDKAKT